MTALLSSVGARAHAPATLPGSQRKVMANTLAAGFAGGATLALVALLLPASRQAEEAGMLGTVAAACLTASLLLWRSSAVSPLTLQVALGWGSTLIAAVSYFSAERPSPLVCFYLWVFLYASYFLTKRQAIVQVLYVALLYGLLLAIAPPSSDTLAWWTELMGALVMAGVLTYLMRTRVETLIERLYGTARTDPLTGLPNRRGFRELLDLELQRARRGDAKASVILGDVDEFKRVNDRAGHHVGDCALQRIALLLQEHMRKIDLLARVEGEEFALILPQADEHGALAVAERLRLAIEHAFAKEEIPITISFGVACFPAHAETSASLVRLADEALQLAKRLGCNRCIAHDPEASAQQLLSGARRDIEAERFLSLMLDLAEAADLRFSGSARHSETVARYAEMAARELGLSEDRIARVRLAGMLHDIGKICIPDSILRKPGPLTEQELTVIRSHPALGAEIIDHPTLAEISAWVRAHHERPDGKGYPHRISGQELPLEARIIAVADAYEAMTSDRSYRDSIGHAAAGAELCRCAGSQFDERVVSALLNALGSAPERAEGALAEA